MMGKKKLSEYKAELIALLNQLPAESPQAWFAAEIDAAKKDPNRDVETLEMLRAALERKAKKGREAKPRRRTTSRKKESNCPRYPSMAIARKLKRILEERFPPPDKVVLRDEDRIIGIITSKRFRRMDTMKRQDLIHDILTKNLTEKERRDVLLIVAVTPEEEIANAGAVSD